MAAETDEIAAIEDIGPKIAESVVTYFASPVNIDLIERLKELGLNMEMEAAELDTAHPFTAKPWCLPALCQRWTAQRRRPWRSRLAQRLRAA